MLKFDLIIWDMDGTLLQTANVVPDSFIDTAQAHCNSKYSREEIVALYSLGVPEKMLTHIFGREPSTTEMQYFYETLAKRAADVSVYPGITNCLTALTSKVAIAVFTGASQRSAEILLKSTELERHFHTVVGGDNFPPKPDPAGILAVVDAIGCTADRVAYIGDAPTDMKASLSAGVTALAAGWGHLFEAGSGETAILSQPSDVVDMLSS